MDKYDHLRLPGDFSLEIEKNRDGSDLPVLRSRRLRALPFLNHAFMTRMGGVGTGIYESMNLSFSRGEARENVERNYERVAELFHSSPEHFVTGHQTHSGNVRVVTEEDRGKGITRERDYQDVDALITDVPGIILTMIYADCVPVFFADPVHRAIGVAHAGWRGSAQKICRKTVEALGRNYGSYPEELRIAIGPSIGQRNYEVSEEVIEIFRESFRLDTEEKRQRIFRDFSSDREGRWHAHLDLWEANKMVLREAGVPEENIDITQYDTYLFPELFFSHRYTRGKHGNHAGFLEIVEGKNAN